ncbi:cytochrome C assembly family protein [Motilimonas eburnea]|uniref:cytochrome C assembly family protein n=1 Tax=Motilimonas eburnea TaxID=1737488 RepID=UPI001E5C52F2|nr:cytochrome c biogenesis protein CcsA [Motilimonas eburnea]
MSILALTLYAVATIACLSRLLHHQGPNKTLVLGAAMTAVACHSAWLYQDIFVASGQNLSLMNVAALVSLIIALVLSLAAFKLRVWVILPVAYGFAMVNLAGATLLPTHYITHLETHPEIVLHISIALLSYSTLMIAGLFATLLGFLDYQLKQKRKPLFHPALPPLMTIEKQLFQLIFIGTLLLSLSLASGFLFLNDMFAQGKAHKALLSIIAWFLYVTLLWGHYIKGWRGKPVIYATVIGAFVLTLAYFGSRFVKEIILT